MARKTGRQFSSISSVCHIDSQRRSKKIRFGYPIARTGAGSEAGDTTVQHRWITATQLQGAGPRGSPLRAKLSAYDRAPISDFCKTLPARFEELHNGGGTWDRFERYGTLFGYSPF
jgi:hypothetical protein